MIYEIYYCADPVFGKLFSKIKKVAKETNMKIVRVYPKNEKPGASTIIELQHIKKSIQITFF